MNNMNTLTKIPTGKQLWTEFQKGLIESVQEFGKRLVEVLEVKPHIIDEMVEAGAPRALLTKLERVGREQIHPSLFFETSATARRLTALPMSAQQTVLADGVEVMDNDEQTTRMIPFNSLTPEQSALVFNCDHIRSLAEQRTFIRSKKAAARPPVEGADYYIPASGGVDIHTARNYTKEEFLLIFGKMK
jgi:hypothetical protein